jgi:phosphoglycerate dehydrogenase-like enzyme
MLIAIAPALGYEPAGRRLPKGKHFDMRILIPDAIYEGEPTIERAAAPPGTEITVYREHDPARIPDDVWHRADALIVWHIMPIDGAMASRLGQCRIVVRAGVGFDQIDLAAFASRGIPVCNCPDYGTTDVADHAIALYLSLARGIAYFQDALRADPVKGWRWEAPPLIGRVRGRTFGVIGMGRIGTAAARRARALDMAVLFHDPYVPEGQELALGFERTWRLEELLERADVLSLHAPLTSETRRIIDGAAFARMRKGAILVNTARGGIVDIDALHDALRSGRLAGAGIDVLPEEPPDPNHPLIRAFCQREPWLDGRFVLSPHAAFYSDAGMVDLRSKPIRTAIAYLRDGQLRNCVNTRLLKRTEQG